MKHRLLVGVGLAVTTALVTPWNAVAATSPAPHVTASATQHTSDPTVNGCDFTETPTTWTLTADCTATATIHIPDGVTLIGGAHLIFAKGSFTGAVVENGGATMSIENLFILGSNLSAATCNAIIGVFFNNASGSLTNVSVESMTRGNGCQTGFGMQISATKPQTVTITRSGAANFQKAGLVATGPATVNVSDSTFGFPDFLPGVIAQNVLQYSDGAGGTLTGNALFGVASGRTDAFSTDMLLSGAADLTVSGNAVHGLGTDIGIAVFDSTDITIGANSIAHGPLQPGVTNHFGTFGVFVDKNSSDVSTAGNTFSGWQHNIVLADQEPYIVNTSPLPAGMADTPYSALLLAIVEDPSDLTWSVVHGSLPPGLHLKNDAAVAGTPTQAGTFTFTLRVEDGPDGTSAERGFTVTIRPAHVSLRVTKTAFPNPAAAGQPITFTITVSNDGPGNARGVIVNDGLPAGFTGFTWHCFASAPPTRCSETSGTGSISDAPVDIAAGGSVTFKLSGFLPGNTGGQVINTASVTPEPGAVDPGCTPDCSASVTVPVGPALPLTGPDLLPEAAGGTGLTALGGLILLITWRRKRRVSP